MVYDAKPERTYSTKRTQVRYVALEFYNQVYNTGSLALPLYLDREQRELFRATCHAARANAHFIVGKDGKAKLTRNGLIARAQAKRAMQDHHKRAAQKAEHGR